jgi:hypothetical protein
VATEEIACLVKPEDHGCIHKNPHSYFQEPVSYFVTGWCLRGVSLVTSAQAEVLCLVSLVQQFILYIIHGLFYP